VVSDDGDDGSITQWFKGLRLGDRQGVGPLWDRYIGKMIRLARATLRAKVRCRTVADEEDVAVSAFETFRRGVEGGRFPDLNSRDDLWRLLAVITVRKARAQARWQRRAKRGGGRVLREVDLAAAGADVRGGLDGLHNPESGPEFAALAAEELRRLLDLLGDDSLRRIAVWRLEGFTSEEIAGRLGCARRTVARRLELIRKLWSAGAGDELGSTGTGDE
jgi:DNA-directed RNA polymerase specialized sigma24 family protein